MSCYQVRVLYSNVGPSLYVTIVTYSLRLPYLRHSINISGLTTCRYKISLILLLTKSNLIFKLFKNAVMLSHKMSCASFSMICHFVK